MDNFWIGATLNTLKIVFSVVTLSFFFAVPCAWLLERSNLHGKKFLKTFLTLPYIIPSYLLAVSWITLANPDVGWLNVWAHEIFGVERFFNIYGIAGVIFVESSALFSILLISFQAALKRMDPSIEEAARLSGASPFRVFLKITLPLLKNNIILGLISVALASLASFGVPAMLGTPGRTFVLTTGIYSLFLNGTQESFVKAIEISLIVVLVTLIIVAISRMLSRQNASFLGSKNARASLIDLGGWNTPLSCFIYFLFSIFLALPLLALVFSSFQSDPSRFSFDSLTLNYWKRVLGLGDFHKGLLNSLLTSFVSALTISLIALAYSLVKWKLQLKSSLSKKLGLRVFQELAFTFYSLPGTVLALLLIVGFRMSGLFSIADTVVALIIAFVLKYLSLGITTLTPSTLLVHPSLIEAAQLSGAGWGRRLIKIWIPILRPSLYASFLLVLMPCLGELTISKLLSAPSSQNLGVLLFELQEYSDRASAAVVGSILLVLVSLLQIFIGRLNREP